MSLREEPLDLESDRVEGQRLESEETGKVVYSLSGLFFVNGEAREKQMVAHQDDDSWALQYHGHGGRGFVDLARGDSAAEVLDAAGDVMRDYDC